MAFGGREEAEKSFEGGGVSSGERHLELVQKPHLGVVCQIHLVF